MGGGGQDTVKTTTSSNNNPWKPAQPALKAGLGRAEDLFDQNIGGQVDTTSRVIPFADQSMASFNDIESRAGANMGGAGLSGQYQGILDAGGFNPTQQRATSYLDGIGENPFDLSGNAAYQAHKGNVLDDVQHRVNEGMSAAGRYGSGAHTSNLVNELTEAGTAMDMAQFGRMDALNSQRFNAGQEGMSNLEAAYKGMGMPGQELMGVGSAFEDLATRQKNDEIRIFDESQNKPWEMIGRLNAVAGGAGQFGTSTTQAQQPVQQPNPWLQAAGLGLGGLGMLGGF